MPTIILRKFPVKLEGSQMVPLKTQQLDRTHLDIYSNNN